MTAAPPLHHAEANPKTATALPQMLIGRLMGRKTWLPPPVEDTPEVVKAPQPPPPCPLRSTSAPPMDPACASPNAARALPLTSIGMEIGAYTWLPPSVLEFPDVCRFQSATEGGARPTSPPAPRATEVAAMRAARLVFLDQIRMVVLLFFFLVNRINRWFSKVCGMARLVPGAAPPGPKPDERGRRRFLDGEVPAGARRFGARPTPGVKRAAASRIPSQGRPWDHRARSCPPTPCEGTFPCPGPAAQPCGDRRADRR